MQSLKVVIVGDTQVGKSCIGARYTQGTFDSDTTPTIGAAFLTKVISTEKGSVRLQLWDTAGQEKFKSLAPMYYRSAGVVIIVYSVTNYSSYESAREWARDIREKASPLSKIVLVGNKIDLDDERVISKEDLNTMAAEIHADYAIEVSAKTNHGITALFTRIAVLCEDGNNYMDKIGDHVIIPEQPKGGCC